MAEVVFGCAGTQLWPPLLGPAKLGFLGQHTSALLWSGMHKNLSLGSTHVTTLKEGKVHRGCQRSLYSLVLCLFALRAFFTAFPPLPQKLSTLENNLVIFLTLRNLGLIALFYGFLVGS